MKRLSTPDIAIKEALSVGRPSEDAREAKRSSSSSTVGRSAYSISTSSLTTIRAYALRRLRLVAVF
jgi:hypothetical protein